MPHSLERASWTRSTSARADEPTPLSLSCTAELLPTSSFMAKDTLRPVTAFAALDPRPPPRPRPPAVIAASTASSSRTPSTRAPAARQSSVSHVAQPRGRTGQPAQLPEPALLRASASPTSRRPLALSLTPPRRQPCAASLPVHPPTRPVTARRGDLPPQLDPPPLARPAPHPPLSDRRPSASSASSPTTTS